MNVGSDPIALAFGLALLGLVPILVITTTSFLKISITLSMLRNALGVQQIPPNMAIYALSLLLTVYVMAPVGAEMGHAIEKVPTATADLKEFITEVKTGSEPLRKFMLRNSKPAQRGFFVATAKQLWPADFAADVQPDDFLVLVPAFMVGEMTSAFQIGFLLYLPFIVIDLVVSNVLMAMGMMMVSPTTISLPLKLFLFVMIDGWSRMIHGIVQSYIHGG